MIRCRFEEFITYLKTNASLLRFKSEQLESEVNGLSVEPGGGNETTQGVWLANFRYTGLIYIERMPGSMLALLALMTRAWLDEHDDLRDKYNLAAPEITTTKDDNTYLTVLINVDWIDEAHVVPAENGPIEWNGQTFNAGEFVYNIAEAGTVAGAPFDGESEEQ